MEYSNEMINRIKCQYQLPCYVFDEEEFRKNYQRLLSALRFWYPKYEIAYSYKTNYAPKLCSIVKEMGGYAEVVSDMEYEIAEAVGYESKKIVYNGPYKETKLEKHIAGGGILNIDNLEELNRVVAIADQYSQLVKVGLRVNFSVGQSFISRFGIDADSEDLAKAVEIIKACKNMKLVGLHCHIGQSRSLDAWKRRTVRMLQLADKYIEGIPEYIDLGSGMNGDMHPIMKEQFTDVPTYEEYAEVTTKLVAEHYASVEQREKPILFTEPGTTVDNRYMDLIAEVDSIKRIKGKNLAILNCSFHNLGDVAGSIRLPLQVFSNSVVRQNYSEMDFVGYTCLERDVLYRNYTGELGKGDYVVFGNVGGYSNVDKPPFILPQCTMIGIDKEKEFYTIKRKETTKDILSTYVF